MDVAKRHEFALGTVINQGIFNLPSDISASLLQEEGGGDLNVSFGFVSFQRKKVKLQILTSNLQNMRRKRYQIKTSAIQAA